MKVQGINRKNTTNQRKILKSNVSNLWSLSKIFLNRLSFRNVSKNFDL